MLFHLKLNFFSSHINRIHKIKISGENKWVSTSRFVMWLICLCFVTILDIWLIIIYTCFIPLHHFANHQCWLGFQDDNKNSRSDNRNPCSNDDDDDFGLIDNNHLIPLQVALLFDSIPTRIVIRFHSGLTKSP